MHSRGNVDNILWRAIKSKHLMYFSSMPNEYGHFSDMKGFFDISKT